MQGVIEGFATIGAIIALGAVLAHLGVLGSQAQAVLTRLAFFVASPALMAVVLADADINEIFSRSLIAHLAGVMVAGTIYLLAATLVWHRNLRARVIGLLSTVYVNAGNLGIPIAIFVLGDAAYIAPVLLFQLVVLQPIALTILDRSLSSVRVSLGRTLAMPIRNPMTAGSLFGLCLALTDFDLPRVVAAPLDLVAGMAIPTLLLTYGVSLRLGAGKGDGARLSELVLIAALKLVVFPAMAFIIGLFVLNVDGTALLAVVVIAALPTAQNVFIHATRYRTGVALARQGIFATTVASAVVIFAIAGFLI